MPYQPKEDTHAIVGRVGQLHYRALQILARCSALNETIDPDDPQERYGPLLRLDHLGICGPAVVERYTALGNDPVLFLAVLRAEQLGYCTAEELKSIQAGVGRVFAAQMLTKVRQHLPRFAATSGESM